MHVLAYSAQQRLGAVIRLTPRNQSHHLEYVGRVNHGGTPRPLVFLRRPLQCLHLIPIRNYHARSPLKHPCHAPYCVDGCRIVPCPAMFLGMRCRARSSKPLVRLLGLLCHRVWFCSSCQWPLGRRGRRDRLIWLLPQVLSSYLLLRSSNSVLTLFNLLA